MSKTWKMDDRLYKMLIGKMLTVDKNVIVVKVRGKHDSDMARRVASGLVVLCQKETRVKGL